MWLHLKGEVFDFSASPIAFLSQSSGAAGFLLWSQEDVPGELTLGALPWRSSRKAESALEFSVWIFSS